MKKKELYNLIRETLSEIDLKEAEECGFQSCKCSDGTVYKCKTLNSSEPNCNCCSEANCDAARDLISGGKVSGNGKGKKDGEKIKLSKITNKKITKDLKNNKKTKMAKESLKERFSQLAGIKPLYEMDDKEMESTKEITKEELMNEGPELWTVLGGLMGVIGAAGITTQLQMMAEDPAIAEKYPKLEKVFSMLAKIGGALGSGIK
jgi:hypothetical protein